MTEDYLPYDIDPTMWELDSDTGCWVWSDSERLVDFRQTFSDDGDQELKRVSQYIRYNDAYGERSHLHRIICYNKYGTIQKWQRVRWTCGNTLCINHEHLYLENASVVFHTHTKLTEKEIGDIKIDPRTHAEVAKAYGVSRSLIAKIRIGDRHMSVDPSLTEEELAARSKRSGGKV